MAKLVLLEISAVLPPQFQMSHSDHQSAHCTVLALKHEEKNCVAALAGHSLSYIYEWIFMLYCLAVLSQRL